MAAPNVFATANITSENAKLAVTTSVTAIVANAAASGKVYMVKSLYISNINAVSAGTITVDVYDGSTAFRLVLALSIPITCGFIPIAADAPIFLKEGDSIRLTAGANSVFEAVASYDILS